MTSPRSKQFDDIYFAVENGLAESRYVFLEQNGLPESWTDRLQFSICETGFGTGLNFLCAWTLFEETATKDQHLTYISFEKYPLSKEEILEYLGSWSGEFGGRLERLAENYPLRIGGWHKIRLSERVTLLLIFDDVNRALPELDYGIDCWFLDGHAPAKNPDMWSDTVFGNMGRLSRTGARVATFTAAGFVRRGLEAAGFEVLKAKGYGVKRDMTIGVFGKEGWTDAPRQSVSRVAVIGGGIAGTAAGFMLVGRGLEVDLFEKEGLATGGSKNIRGLFNPRITAQKGPESDLYSSAFSLAVRTFGALSKNHDIGYVRSGSLHYLADEAKDKRYAGFLEHWGWHEDHARLVSREEAAEISGVPVTKGALFLPDAGMVAPYKTVAHLGAFSNIRNEEVLSVDPEGGKWRVNGKIYDAVIFACAADVAKFSQGAFLPVNTVRGQVCLIRQPDLFKNLKTNLCYGGYATRPFDGQMIVGSTFQAWLHDLDLRDEDNADVLEKLSNAVEGFEAGTAEIEGARAAFRCASKDRVPVIGKVPEHEGLYFSVAHGSHGLITSLIGADMIAAEISGEVQPVPRSLYVHLSAQRFIDRAARRAG